MGSDEIGKRIKEARTNAGLTQDALGALIGCSGVAIMRYEKGSRKVSLAILEKIASSLGITPVELVGPEWFDMQLGPDELEKLKNDIASIQKVDGTYGEGASDFLNLFALLNETGQRKAFEYLSDLSEQTKYQKYGK